jgi:hypothetical protein
MKAIIGFAFCLLFCVSIFSQGWTALLWFPAGFGFGLFSTAQIVLPPPSFPRPQVWGLCAITVSLEFVFDSGQPAQKRLAVCFQQKHFRFHLQNALHKRNTRFGPAAPVGKLPRV